MATRFVRIDLSDEARDFRPIAVEPGVPLLDKSSSNAKILFRWLGGLVAEPAWEAESVSFFVRDDHGGRFEEVVCHTATREDLEGTLKEDVATLRDRIEKAKPETPTERAVRKTILRCFQELVDNPHRTDLDDYFFRYRDVQGKWRLVWCWGYQRVDQEPAPAVVCTDPECSLLFVRRPHQTAKCPSCAAALARRPRRKWKSVALVALLLLLLGLPLLLLLGGAGWYWYTHPTRLVATPETWSGPAGSRIEFKVHKAGLFSKEDVTGQAVGIVFDPQVARLDSSGNAALAVNPGRTVVRFHLGSLPHTDATLVVQAATNPDKIVIEPRNVELGIGTTARPKLFGLYKDGNKVDLTGAAEWSAQNDKIVFVYNGLLEGMAEGTTAVLAKYRATPESPYLDASASVSVAKIDLQSLEMAVEPPRVAVGRTSPLRVDATSDDGKRYSVLESSLLRVEVRPSYLATVQGASLKGEQVGKGKLAATFNDKLTAGAEFEVVAGVGVDRLVVKPEKLPMVVGEIADLSIVSPSSAPIEVSSSDPAVVEATAARRLIGRKEGMTQVQVTQGNEKATVEVTVAAAEFSGIAVDPARVVVPVDDAVTPRVMGRIEGDRNVEIAPDLVAAEKIPSPRYADFDPKSLRLRGIRPTEASAPQTLAVRFGKHAASAPVEVVIPPLRLVLTPGGPIELPAGQMMRLMGWANYSGGRRVLVPPERMQFNSAPAADSAPGLELRGEKVAALKPGAGPLPVYAAYLGRESNRVIFRSVEARPITLRLEVDRTLRLAGETGAVGLSAVGPDGDVELVPEMAGFESSAPDVLQIDTKTGAFRAAAPGESVVQGRHLAAKEPASLKLRVYDPAKARLVFEPDSVQVAVNEMARLTLFLEVNDGGKPERAPLFGPGVGYAIGQPQAIRWYPPTLVGLRPAPPFEVSASFAPYLGSTASAKVEVTPVAEPDAIRIVPSTASLAPGQALALRVEQQLPGTPDQWREVRPDAVTWTVPPALVWSPPNEDLHPMATIPQGARGEYELRAHYAGKQAVGSLTVKSDAPDAKSPLSRLVVAREPGGEFLPVGHQQRYTIMVEHDGLQEPAADVQWPDNFGNEYVRWQAPVLTAKQGGYQQWLRAVAGGRTVLFRTSTYEPGKYQEGVLPDRGDRPLAVKILSDQGPLVRFPVGAAFDDFRVEAHYADGFTRVVTKKATLRTPEPPQSAPLTPSGGRLLGVRPGRTAVHAEFEGVASKQPLGVEVSGQVDIDQIRLAPARIDIRKGETVALEATGFKGGKSVGVLTGLGGLSWRSSNPAIADVKGPSVTAVELGQAAVTAALGSITSEPAPVSVVATIADPLVVDPKGLRLRVGEAARIGVDLSVFRGQMDVSRQCAVSPALPGIVRYDQLTHSLVGMTPGTSPVTLAFGDKLANLTVEVVPGGAVVDGQVVLEPGSGTLAPGQALPLRVFVVAPGGVRIDRTSSAVLSSSDPAKVKILGNAACAVSPGVAQVTATLPESQKTATALMTVNDEQIAELYVDPPRADLSVGDRLRLRVLGRAPSGTFELFPQPDLVLGVGGPNPAAIRIAGGTDVDAVAPGQAEVAVNWRNCLSQQVPIGVGANPLADLRIEPGRATAQPGQTVVYQVTGLRGGQRRVLGPEHGVELFVGDQQVGQVVGPMAVRANNPGRTTVVAQVGNQRAEASLDVTTGPAVITTDPRIVTTYDPRNYYGPGDRWWDPVRRIWVGPRVVGPGGPRVYVEGPLPPTARVVGLRFVPDVARLGVNSPPTGVRVVELLADGTLGRDVSADPNLELTQPPDVVKVEKTAAGPVLHPIGQGQTRIGAKLGDLTADALLVSVGEQLVGTARLEVNPDPLIVWSGEVGGFGSVRVNPGGGQLPLEVEYKVTPAANQGVAESAGEKFLRGLSPGVTQVVVTAVDPAGAYQGLSASATVQVIPAERLWIEPQEISLQVGQATPPLAVMAQGRDGLPYQVPATLQSTDEAVLSPDPQAPGRFVAKAFGGTQVRAEYRGREAFAKVMVTGQRFIKVDTALNEGADDFDVGIRVLAAGSEGPLEYRVYAQGQAPPVAWTPAQAEGDARRVELRSPRLQYGPRGTIYHLIVEARDTAGGAPQQYPLSFRLKQDIQRTDFR